MLSESTIIALADWYHFRTPSIPLIINTPLTHKQKRTLQLSPPSSNAELLAVNVDVEAGKPTVCVWRLVSFSYGADYAFSIDGHWMTINRG